MSELNEFNFSNVGTHFPLKYSYGPGYVVDEEKIFLDNDDTNPNQVNYDLEKNQITTSEEEMSGSINQKKIKSNIISRNVNNRRRRYIR